MDYYKIVVAAAQAENKPQIAWRDLDKLITLCEKKTNRKVDRNLLHTAWQDFRHAPASRIVYS